MYKLSIKKPRQILKKILYLILFIVLGSCSFNFSDDYYNDIELQEVDLNVTLTNLQKDEVLISSREILYQFPNSRNTLYNISIYLDGVLIEDTSNNSGSFTLDLNTIEDGEHLLEVSYSYSTNSGSLASILDAEAFTKLDRYPFTVDKSLSNPFEIERVEIVDGTIFIYWNEAPDYQDNEVYLVVTHRGLDGYEYISNEISLSDEIIENGVFNDTLTILYDPIYHIKVVNEFEEKKGAEIQLIMDQIEVLSVNLINGTDFEIEFSEHPLYSNFEEYYVWFQRSFSGGVTTLKKSLDPKGGTVALDGYHFGPSGMSFYFRTGSSIFATQVHYLNYRLGSKLDLELIVDVVYSSKHDEFYLLEENSVKVYTGEFQLKETISFSSISGSSVFKSIELDETQDYFYVDSNEQAITYDISLGRASEYYTVSEFGTHSLNSIAFVRGNLFFVDDDSNQLVAAYDINSKNLIIQQQKNEYFSIGRSPSYFSVDGLLYENTEGSFLLYDDLNSYIDVDVEYVEFGNDDENLCFGNYTRNWTGQEYNVAAKTASRSRLWDAGHTFRDINYTEDSEVFTIGYFNSGGIRATKTDLSGNTSEMRIYSTQDTRYWYFNGYIIDSDGYHLKTNLFY